MTDASSTLLPNRASIIITGDDRYHFLQGLITQDLNLLDQASLVYGCLLTPQGKFLYDFFIRKHGDALILDCEGGDRATTLFQKLSMYKLRSKVDLQQENDTHVWQVWGADAAGDHKDPRHKLAGYRYYSEPVNAQSVNFDTWDEYRIKLEIPDGSRDLLPEKSFIHEGRLDEFHAVSYSKGCYVGQELVSRMHHRGLTKKILKCVEIDNLPENAELRSSCNNVGLAIVRL